MADHDETHVADPQKRNTQSLLNEISRLRETIAVLEKKLRNEIEPNRNEKTPGSLQKIVSEFAPFALENISDGAFLIAQDASILYVNRAACFQLGYSAQELLALTILDINPTLTNEIWRSVWGVTVKNKFQAIETVHRSKDGRNMPVEVLANYFELNGVQYSCSFTRDITNRKEMETRIRQSEKMEAIGQLAGGIAHDFNNQLSGILGYAGLLKMELAGKPELKQYAEGIITAGQRSAGLTAQLLAFSRQGKYLSVPVDLHSLIDETVQILQRSINKNIKIIMRFDAENSITTGDPAQLENAFLNLAINARDAMPSGGELVFSTRDVELDEAFRAESIFEIQPGQYIQVRVADTGAGMTKEVMQRLFEPFFTTKEQGKGTGMGLASVYGTIKNHKGAVEVQSQEGKGTEFTLYLPSTPCGETTKNNDNRSENQTNISARVLLVDDESLVRGAVKKMLEGLGCRVVTAENGVEAVELYKSSSHEIDVVILDLIMPQMSGQETFIQMRKINPCVAAIVASGYSLEGAVQEMLEQGAQGFLQKPFDAGELAETLSKIVNRIGRA